MNENGMITKSCVDKGFMRLYDQVQDLFLDLPAAFSLTVRWVDKALKAKFITKDLADKCPRPTRARSRTLSQGPNGKLSCTDTESMDENDDKIADKSKQQEESSV